MILVNFRYNLTTLTWGANMKAQIIETPHRGNNYKFVVLASGKRYELSQAAGAMGERGTLVKRADGSYRFVSDSQM